MKKYIRVDIVDNDNGYHDERIMDTYILVNPDESKLKELQILLENRSEEENEFYDDYGSIYDYIKKNFEVLNIEKTIEIEW